jgi:hypothetical protein
VVQHACSFYLYASPTISLYCVTEGEHCGEWLLSMDTYISSGVSGGNCAYCEHNCHCTESKYLKIPGDELSLDERGYLQGSVTFDFHCTTCDNPPEYPECSVTLTWRPLP